MNIELIDKDDNDRLESLSLELDKSKGTISLELCEFFFGSGVPHLVPVRKRLSNRATAA